MAVMDSRLVPSWLANSSCVRLSALRIWRTRWAMDIGHTSLDDVYLSLVYKEFSFSSNRCDFVFG